MCEINCTNMVYFVSNLPFGMYPLICLYCTLLFVADAAQNFWNKNEFCLHLNSERVKNKLVDVIPVNASITCVEFNHSLSADAIKSIENVRLLCREFDSLTYIWDYKNNSKYGVTVLVELMSYNSTDTADIHYIWPSKTNSSYVSVDDLNPGTEYAARFWTLVDGTASLTTNTRVRNRTLDLASDAAAVRAINYVSGPYKQTNGSALRTAFISWTPSKDVNCHYRIKYFPKNNIENPPLNEFFVNVTESFSTTLFDLNVSTKYMVILQSYYSRTMNPPIEGKRLQFLFETDSANRSAFYSKFDPEDPDNVKVLFVKDWGNSVYDMTVSWESPNASAQGVQYFMVKLCERSENVSANKLSPPTLQVHFSDVLISRNAATFWASVQAFSQTGRSKEKILSLMVPPLSPADGIPWMWTTAAAGGLAFCAAALAVAKRAYRLAAEDVDRVAAADDRYARLLENLRQDVHAWLGVEDVAVSDQLLGRGHFGVVRKGALRTVDGGECPVAVKSLRDRPSGRDLEAFLGEILLMQKVGKHPNIVSMIGCCLDANKRCMLVVEYCPLGDLQSFLKKVSIKSWYANDFYVSRVDAAELTSTAATESDKMKISALQDAGYPPPMAFNNCYLCHSEEDVFLTVDDLMRFASQAANGMVFLENNRIVHRDLAARNVLLSDHQTIKICDFGLSRDVYEQNLYQKSNRGDPMPVKWMALESLKHRIYTTQSDVWSFGVLLWEIMMLGECPYSDISTSNLYEMLRRGYRMPKPTLCCYSLYELMLECWQSNPGNRPKFGTIKDTIDGIMNNQYS